MLDDYPAAGSGPIFGAGAEEYLTHLGYSDTQRHHLLRGEVPRHTPLLLELYEKFGLRQDVVTDAHIHVIRSGPYEVCPSEYFEYEEVCLKDDPEHSTELAVKGLNKETFAQKVGLVDFSAFATTEAEVTERFSKALLFCWDEPETTVEFDYVNANGEVLPFSVVVPTAPHELLESFATDCGSVHKASWDDEPVRTYAYGVHLSEVDPRWKAWVKAVFDCVFQWNG